MALTAQIASGENIRSGKCQVTITPMNTGCIQTHKGLENVLYSILWVQSKSLNLKQSKVMNEILKPTAKFMEK